MDFMEIEAGRYMIGMTASEIAICRAALREVLFGLEFPDFEARMGCGRELARAVIDSLPKPTIEEIDRTRPGIVVGPEVSCKLQG